LKLKDPTLPQDLLNNIQGLWDKLREQANDKIQQHQVNCDEQYNQLQQENKTQKSESEKLQENFEES
jgi:dTDP-D-glucose 4,6-dehydratase